MESISTKQLVYAEQKIRLKKAMSGGFYYEAILIEYAMFEDRTNSVLKNSNCKITNSRGNPLKLSEKLNKINDSPEFQSKYIKQRLPRELIEAIREWKDERNTLVHDLMNTKYDVQAAKEIAEKGKELFNRLDNGVRSVNKHNQKLQQIKEI